MITNNYKNLLRTIFSGKDTSMVTIAGAKKYHIIAAENLITESYCPANLLLSKYRSGYNGICFGRGATPSSASDYTLEDMILSSLEIVFPTAYREIMSEDGKTLYTITYTLRNTGSTDITINEIGIIGTSKVYDSSTSVSSYAKSAQMLIDRTVLEEPLIIPPGEIRALTYNLEFDLNFE